MKLRLSTVYYFTSKSHQPTNKQLWQANPRHATEEEPSSDLGLNRPQQQQQHRPQIKPQLNIPTTTKAARQTNNLTRTLDRTPLAMASDLDLDSIYTFAIQLGKDAGRMLQEAAQRRMSGDDQLVEEEKLNSVDIVTKTDEGEWCCFLDTYTRDCDLFEFHADVWSFVTLSEVEAFIRQSVLEKYPSHKYVRDSRSNEMLTARVLMWYPDLLAKNRTVKVHPKNT